MPMCTGATQNGAEPQPLAEDGARAQSGAAAPGQAASSGGVAAGGSTVTASKAAEAGAREGPVLVQPTGNGIAAPGKDADGHDLGQGGAPAVVCGVAHLILVAVVPRGS